MHGPEPYAEYLPPPALRPFVECFWTRGPSTDRAPCEGAPDSATIHGDASREHRVLPDGSLDLILAAGGGWTHAGARAAAMPGAYIIGPMTGPQLLVADPTTRYTGVRFRPGAAAALLARSPDLPGRSRRAPDAASLADLRVPVEEIWSDTHRLPDHDILLAAPADRVAAITSVLLLRLDRLPHPPPLVATAIAGLRRSHGTVRIDTLCAALGVTRQHLAREFTRHVGVSPKTLARIERVRHVIALARDGSPSSWSSLAAACGYADQAHLIDDFGALVGVTPSRWIAGQPPSRFHSSKTRAGAGGDIGAVNHPSPEP